MKGMTQSAFALPETIEELKAFALAMAEKAVKLEAKVIDLEDRNAKADERIAHLHQILKTFERARFGRSSEKLGVKSLDDDEQMAFVFEEIATGIAAIEAEFKTPSDPAEAAKRAPRPRKGFAAHLERVEEMIEPEERPELAGKIKVKIGEDVTERLDVTPAKFRVIVTRRPKYVYKDAETNEQIDGVYQAAAPSHIIEGGIPTEALLAFIATSKYADGLPLYRQEAIYARDGVEISRSLMAQWMGRLGFELVILADYILEAIKKAERVFADETTLPTLGGTSGKAKVAYLWAYARDDRPFGGQGPPMVAYRFEDNRSTECVANHLKGYSGILQVDGYVAYKSLAKDLAKSQKNKPLYLAGCWAHLRRKFYELHIAKKSEIATFTLERMKALWAVEDEVRGKPPEIRAAARQSQSAQLVDDLYKLWEQTLARISAKSELAKTIRYATGHRESLERFLHDGRIEIDSNIVERAIRPQTITRKNSLFAGNDGGGRTWATIATLLQTAKMNHVDPYAWLSQTLTRLTNQWPLDQIEELMPWNFKPYGSG